jgi:hypothetical protein
MLICFLDIGGINYFEFLPEVTTVKQTFYAEAMKRLVDTVKRK